MRYVIVSTIVAAVAIVAVGTIFLALEDSVTTTFRICPLH